MTSSPSKPIEPAVYELTATPEPRTFVPTRLAAARLLLFPAEQLRALVERFLHDARRDATALAVAAAAAPNGALAFRRVDLADLDLIDPELVRPPW